MSAVETPSLDALLVRARGTHPDVVAAEHADRAAFFQRALHDDLPFFEAPGFEASYSETLSDLPSTRDGESS